MEGGFQREGALHSTISDYELDLAVSALKVQHPNSGYHMIAGLLGMRESMHHVDSNGITIRWRECIQRRQYNEPYPLALRYLEGNHKLIGEYIKALPVYVYV